MPEVALHHDGHPKYRRMVRFDWSDTPVQWVPDDSFTTHMINVPVVPGFPECLLAAPDRRTASAHCRAGMMAG